MRLPLFMSAFMILLAPLSQAEELPTPQNQATDMQRITELHHDIVQLCQQIWTQLAALSTQQDADVAAPTFREKAMRLTKLDRELKDLELDDTLSTEAKEAMSKLSPRIIESYVTLGSEFDAIYRTDCLQSSKLLESFDEALRGGFFFTSHHSDRPHDLPQLTQQEAEQELKRIEQLLAPDQEAQACLKMVTSSSTAKMAAVQLITPIKRLHSLLPENDLGLRPFDKENQLRYQAMVQPIERTLWGIRAEYVRIATAFSPESEDYNYLANTLDELYLSLEETHPRIFTTIFDQSFLDDMDEAYAHHEDTAHNNFDINNN